VKTFVKIVMAITFQPREVELVISKFDSF